MNMLAIALIVSALSFAPSAGATGYALDVYGYGEGTLDASDTTLTGDLNLAVEQLADFAMVYSGRVTASVVGVDDAGNYLIDYTVLLDNKLGVMRLSGVSGAFTPIDDAGCSYVEHIEAQVDSGFLRSGSATYTLVPDGSWVSIVGYANYCTNVERYVVNDGVLMAE